MIIQVEAPRLTETTDNTEFVKVRRKSPWSCSVTVLNVFQIKEESASKHGTAKL